MNSGQNGLAGKPAKLKISGGLLKKSRALFPWQLYLLGFGFSIGAIFLAVGSFQQWAVRKTIIQKVDRELTDQAQTILQQIDYRNGWSLEGYRRETLPQVPDYYFIVDKSNILADIQGVPPKFRNVRVLDERIFLTARTVNTTYNESWRLFGKKIHGAWIVVGTVLPDNINQSSLKQYDERLKLNLEKFGNSIEEIQKRPTRYLDQEVDFAVVNTDGDLVSGNGGIPLKVEGAGGSAALSIPNELFVDMNGRKLHEISIPITGKNQTVPVATIVVGKDMSRELDAIEELNRVNRKFALITALATAGLGIIFVFQRIIRQSPHLTIEEALKAGEGKNIEFKSTFQCKVGSSELVHEKRLEILKAIAGFLNGDGGNLFIGIGEDPPGTPILRGLQEDLELACNNADSMRRTLNSLIMDRVGRQFSDFISDRVEERNGNLCWIIAVDRSPEPAFVRWKGVGETKEHKHFYVREGPRTADLDLENTWRYIKNRWRQ